MTVEERLRMAESLRFLAGAMENHECDDPKFYRELGFRLYGCSIQLYQQGDRCTTQNGRHVVLDMTGVRPLPANDAGTRCQNCGRSLCPSAE